LKSVKGVRAMSLSKDIKIKKKIDKYRQEMFDLAGKKVLSHPQVIRISQQLDKEIFIWQLKEAEMHVRLWN
jgi:hypothetical protein